MLKGIPSILPPELLKILMEMGHGDELVIGDGNFPAASHGSRVVRCDGHGCPEVLDAILQLMPLDHMVEAPVILMHSTIGSPDPEVWNDYKRIINEREPKHNGITTIERFEFYDRAKKAYAIVTTGETAMRGNIILKKGVC